MSVVEWILVSVAAVSTVFGVIALLAVLRARRRTAAARRQRRNRQPAAVETDGPRAPARPQAAAGWAVFGGGLLAGLLGSLLGGAVIWLAVTRGGLGGLEAGADSRPPGLEGVAPGEDHYLVSTDRGATLEHAAPTTPETPSPQEAPEDERDDPIEDPTTTLEYLRGQLAVVVKQREDQASLLSQQMQLVREYQQQVEDAKVQAEASRAELDRLEQALNAAQAEQTQTAAALDQQRRELLRSNEQLAGVRNRCEELEARLSRVTAARVASDATESSPSPIAAAPAAVETPLDSSGWKAVSPDPLPVQYGRPVSEMPPYGTPVYEVSPPVLVAPGASVRLP